MGKKSRSKAQRRQGDATQAGDESSSPEAQVIAAAQRMVDELQRWAEVVEEYYELRPWIELPEGMKELADRADPPSLLRQELTDLVEAWRIVQSDAPVAGEWPQAARKGGGTFRWHPPLQPRDILFSRQLVLDGTVTSTSGYLEHASANGSYYAREEQKRQDDLAAQCGKPTPKGQPCKSLPVYVPPEGFSAGVGCWRHISAADAERIAVIYDRAVEETRCFGCGAEPGTACRAHDADGGALPMVDGQWPKMR